MQEHKVDHEFEDNNIDIKQYLHKAISYWYLFPISIAIAFSIAFFKFKSTVPIYEVQASILIKDNQKALNINDFDMESLLNFTQIDEKRVNAEKSFLQSFRLNNTVIKNLNNNVDVFRENQFKAFELYPNSPFSITFDKKHWQIIGTKIEVDPIDEESYQLTIEAKSPKIHLFAINQFDLNLPEVNISKCVKYGDTIELDYAKFCINRTQKAIDYNENYYFILYDNSTLANIFSSNTEVITEKKSNVVTLKHETSNVAKGIEYLNMLIQVFLDNSVSKNKEIAQKTIDFISYEIKSISDSLQIAEDKLKNFQSKESLMSLDIITESTYSKLDELQSKKAKLIVELRYFDYLRDYLKANENMDRLLAPSSMGVKDQFLTNLINKLSELNAEKSDLEANTVKDNPYLTGLNSKISELKNSISENVNNIENQHNIEIQELDKRINNLTSKVKQLPFKQRVLFNYERQYDLFNEVFNLLLKKQSEIKISKASMIPLHEVIDYARLVSTSPIKPQKQQLFIIALVVGLIIPIVFIIIMDFFNDRITVYDDIEKLTSYPIIGHILHKKEAEENIVFNDPKSLVSESFRSVRANFQFINKSNETITALITSAGPGAGKSFISLNLASSFASFEKKTVLVSFDLRKPNNYSYPEFKELNGVSAYLSGNKQLNEIIFKTEIPKLDILPVGAIPYNPSELIANENCSRLFEELKEIYQYIIIDTPPLGVVADAYLLTRFADTVITVVRNNHTKKKMLKLLLKNMKQNQVRHNSILVNDIKNSRFGYGYQSGYYNNYYQ